MHAVCECLHLCLHAQALRPELEQLSAALAASRAELAEAQAAAQAQREAEEVRVCAACIAAQ
jgi:hypothetical protein